MNFEVCETGRASDAVFSPTAHEMPLLLDQALAPVLLTVSLVAGSIRPVSSKLGRVAEAVLLATCVITGALGVLGMMA